MTEKEIQDIEILLPYQQEWGRDESPVKVWEKSRRIGASYGEAAISVLEAAKEKKDGGQSTLYLSYNKDMTRQFISDCGAWAKALNKACGEMEEFIMKDEDKDITVFRITFSSGFQIWGLPSEPRSLRSKQGRVIIDEAAFVEDLKALLKAAIALLMWGGSVSILSTHEGEDNPFNELIKEIKAGKIDYSLHRTTIQDALDQGLYERICLVTDREWSKKNEEKWLEELVDFYGEGAAEELYCIPSKGGNKYIPRSLVESCMDENIPVVTYECTDEFTYESEFVRERKTHEWCEDYILPLLKREPNLPGYMGEDFARSGDLSVLSIFRLDGLNLDAAFYVEMRNVPFSQQFQVVCYVWDHHPRMYAASFDARGNGQHIAEITAQKYGQAYVNQVMISRVFYMEYFPKYKARLEDREMTIPGTPEVIDDHRVVTLVKGCPTIPDRTGDKGNKRHGDSAIAGVMAVHAYENDDNDYSPYEYEPMGVDNPWLRGDDDEW